MNLTNSTLSELANDGMYLSYVIGGNIGTLEKDISDLNLSQITPEDDEPAKLVKLIWQLRLAMIKGDAKTAINIELQIKQMAPLDYDSLLIRDWQYFKCFKDVGIIPESAFEEYYQALAENNGYRDAYLLK